MKLIDLLNKLEDDECIKLHYFADDTKGALIKVDAAKDLLKDEFKNSTVCSLTAHAAKIIEVWLTKEGDENAE